MATLDRDVRYAESLGSTTNSSTTWQTKFQLQFTPPANSEYFILQSGLLGINTNSCRFGTRIVNGATQYTSYDHRGGSGSEIHPHFAVFPVTFGASPGQQTFDYQFALTEAVAAITTLSDARLIALSRNERDGYGESIAVTSASTTTYVTRIELALDVPVSDYYFCVFSAETDTFSAPNATGVRLTVDGTPITFGLQANTNSTGWTPIGFAVRVFLEAGTRTLRVEHNTNGTVRSDLRNARLAALYLGTFKSNWGSSQTYLEATTSTTPQVVYSVAADNAAPGDNLVFCSFFGGVNNAVQAHRWDLLESSSTGLMSRGGYSWAKFGAASITVGHPVGWFFARRTFSDNSGGDGRTWQLRHWSTLATTSVWTDQIYLTAFDLSSPERFGSAEIPLTQAITAQIEVTARVTATVAHSHSVTAAVTAESSASSSATVSVPAAVVTATVDVGRSGSTTVAHAVTTAALSLKEDIRADIPPIALTNQITAAYTVTPGARVAIGPLWPTVSAEAVRGTEDAAAIHHSLSVQTNIHTDRSGAPAPLAYDLSMTLRTRGEIVLVDAVAGGAYIDRLMLRSGGFLRTRGGSAFLLHYEGFSSHVVAPSIRTVTAGYGLTELVWGRALDPHEMLYFTIDWSEELGGTEDVIGSGGSTWSLDLAAVTAGVIIPGGAHSYDSNSATVWLAVHPDRQENDYWNGLGQTHKITHQIRTLGGQTMERSVRFNVRTLKPPGA